MMLAEILLYIGGILFILLLLGWSVFTAYIYLLHRRYSHIPSPKMPSFYMGHYPVVLKVIAEERNLLELFCQWTQEIGPVYVWFVVHHPVICTMNPDDVKELCTKPHVLKCKFVYKYLATSYGERFLGRGLITIPDYDTWKPRRRKYDPAFSRSYLKNLIPAFNECVDEFVERLVPLADGKTQVPMKEEFAALTLRIISKVAFDSDFTETLLDKSLGLKYVKGNGTVTFLTKHTIEGAPPSLIKGPLWKYLCPRKAQGYRETARAIRAVGRECIWKRINAIENGEQVPNDILTHILKIRTKEETVDIEVLVDDFVTFYIAGQETSASLLSFTLVLLCQHSDVRERVLAEISEVLHEKREVTFKDLEELQYLDQVFMESLRLYPPVGAFTKQAPKGLKLSNYEIPEGTIITVSSLVSSRLPEFFEEPLIFDPSRFDPDRKRPSPFVYFPFSVGHRSCIGKVFAMMEAKTVMSRLLQQFQISLPEGYKLHVDTTAGYHPKGNVPCTLISAKGD